MSTGTVLSAVAHGGLIAWVVLGNPFSGEPDPVEVTSVSVISVAEFEALTNPTAPPAPQEAVVPIVAPIAEPKPEPEPSQPAPAPQPEPAIEPVVAPEPVVEPTPEPTVEEVADPEPTPVPEPQPEPEVVILPEPEAEVAPEPEPQPLAVATATRPRVRPADLIAPTEVAPTPDTQVADATQEAVVESEQPTETAQNEAQEATAPEAATTEVVTEADELAARVARASLRPRTRPLQPTTPEVSTDTAASIEAALAGLDVDDTPAAAAAAPQAAPGPLTAADLSGFRLEPRCWNRGTLSTLAMQTTVVIGLEFTRDGRPIANSLKLVEHDAPDDIVALQAYEAARRAILECGVDGFGLPEEKYDQWRRLELAFKPPEGT